MTPFWIVNFMEKGSIEPFFETYWRAFLQNDPTTTENDKFFHITVASEPSMTKETLQDIASQRLSRDVEGNTRLIPAFKNPNGNRINVIFVGDITNEKTIERFHTWAAHLMKQKMRPNGAWFSINFVTLYGILIRPDSSTVDDKVVTPEIKGFLNELQTMEQMDINHRPFEHVLFLQASENEVKRTAAEEAMCIAAYHIARTDGKCFQQSSNYRFHDANATGVFFEADVQKELDASSLGQIILNDFVANQGRDFLDIDEAKIFVDDNGDFLSRVTPQGIKTYLTNGIKCPENADIKRPIHPLNILKIGKVWREYYGKYIKNLKRELVNNIRRNLIVFESSCTTKLSQNQIEFIKENTNTLQELVFQMFCETGDRNRFRHVSLPQSLKVLEIFKERIENKFCDEAKGVKAFVIPKHLLDAANKAKENNWTSDHILDVLTEKLQTLSVYNLARLLRVLLCGGLLGEIIGSFACFLGWFVIPIILIIDIIVFNAKVSRIEALKEQYIGMKLTEMRDQIDKTVDKLLEKTKNEITQYISWLRENKLEWLQKSLSVIAAPSFQFKVSDVFQPLVSISSTKADEPKLLIPAKGIRGDSLAELVGQSGSFGRHPLTRDVPTAEIQGPDGTFCRIYNLINSRKNVVQYLVQELMREHQRVADGTEEQIEFQTHETQIRNMLLILDVSGSMSGTPIEELKGYVNELTSKHQVEWIAFSNDVCFTSEDTEVDELEACGGTCYIPAIEKAIEWIKSGKQYDDIILISDGYPFESDDEIIKTAKSLNQPLNTISIGDSAETVLVKIALQTGGEEVTIESFKDLPEKWEDEILPRVCAVDDGDYSFGNLLKRCQTIPAAVALRKFALKKLESSNLTLPKIIGQYGVREGLEEWLSVTSQCNTLKQGALTHSRSFLFATASINETDNMESKLASVNITNITYSDNEPDMIASLMTEQPLDRIGDLQWAPTLGNTDDDQSVNNKEMLSSLTTEQHIEAINIHNNPLKLK